MEGESGQLGGSRHRASAAAPPERLHLVCFCFPPAVDSAAPRLDLWFFFPGRDFYPLIAFLDPCLAPGCSKDPIFSSAPWFCLCWGLDWRNGWCWRVGLVGGIKNSQPAWIMWFISLLCSLRLLSGASVVRFASKTCSFDPSLGAARLLQRRGSRLLLPPEISSSGIVFSVVLRFSLQNLWRVCFLVLPVIV